MDESKVVAKWRIHVDACTRGSVFDAEVACEELSAEIERVEKAALQTAHSAVPSNERRGDDPPLRDMMDSIDIEPK